MLWFGKKKKDAEAAEVEDANVEAFDESEATEDEILELLNEDEDADAEAPEEETDAEEAEEDGDSEVPADVIKAVSSVDELVGIISAKPIGAMQFMRKEGLEVFALKEVYLRIAEVWGSVSMAREYTPAEYARIMLAIELLESPDDFYVLPTVTDEERENAIITFCDEKYGGGGKKYARNTERFAKMVRDNGDMEEWLAHSKYILTEKIIEFCERNGIDFGDNTEDGAEKSDE